MWLNVGKGRRRRWAGRGGDKEPTESAPDKFKLIGTSLWLRSKVASTRRKIRSNRERDDVPPHHSALASALTDRRRRSNIIATDFLSAYLVAAMASRRTRLSSRQDIRNLRHFRVHLHSLNVMVVLSLGMECPSPPLQLTSRPQIYALISASNPVGGK